MSSPAWGEDSLFYSTWTGGKKQGEGKVEIYSNYLKFSVSDYIASSRPFSNRSMKVSFSDKLLDYNPKVFATNVCSEIDCISQTVKTDPPGVKKMLSNVTTMTIENLTQNYVTVTQVGYKTQEPTYISLNFILPEQTQGEIFNFCLTDMVNNIGPECKDITIPFPAPPKLEFQNLKSSLTYGKENVTEIKVKPEFTKNAKDVKLIPGKDLLPAEPIATLTKGQSAIVGKISPSL